MHRSTLGLVFHLSIVLAVCESTARACTIFSVSRGGRVLAGNNEDNSYASPASVWFVPPGPHGHGRVCLGWDGFAQGGMNDQGLFMDWAALPEPRAPDFGMKPDFPGNIVERVLARCSTVEDALGLFEKYTYRGKASHFLIADARGGSAVGEWLEGAFHAIRRTGDHHTITNFPLLDPGRGNHPCRRFDVASRMLEEAGEVDAARAAKILEAASVDLGGSGTTYSNVCDLAARRMILHHRRDFARPITIDLTRDLKSGFRLYLVETLHREGRVPDDPPSPKKDAGFPDASDLVRRHVEAIGGREALLRLRSIRRTGTISFASGARGTLEMVSAAPAMLVYRGTIEGLGNILSCFDGTAGWEVTPRGRRRIEGDELGSWRWEADFHAWLLDEARYRSRCVVRRGRFDGREAFEVQMTRLQGEVDVHYFDTKTHLLIGTVAEEAGPAGWTWTRSAFSGYRPFCGVRIPMRIAVLKEGAKYDIAYDSVACDDARPEEFAAP